MTDILYSKITDYPDKAKQRLIELHNAICDIASQRCLGKLDVTLKWGELSYSVKSGSPIRIDWKSKSPDSCFVYFNCSTKLVDTFRELYPDDLIFHGNRAIELNINDPLPETFITQCLELALTYHKVKHLPLLGA